jgi:hypothetical protein
MGYDPPPAHLQHSRRPSSADHAADLFSVGDIQENQMKITKEWLKEKSACSEGIEWFLSKKESDSIKVLKALISDDKLDWANWLIVRVMERKQYLAYAIYAAEQIIAIFEKKYPDDKRPRKAIKAAKSVLESDTKENRTAAAYAASYAAASAASYAADAADDAASYAASSAAVKREMKIRILKYGIGLLSKAKQ